MSTLGGRFPPEFLRGRILRQLVPGKVIKLRHVMDDGQIHEKRFVLVKVDDDSVCCVINSEVSRFIEARPDLLRCQVAIVAADHSFMTHDSYIDCSKTWTFATTKVVNDLMDQTDWILGEVSYPLREEMIAALKFSPLLSPKEVGRLCAELEPPPW